MNVGTPLKITLLALVSLAAQSLLQPSWAQTNSSGSASYNVTGIAVPVCVLGSASASGAASNATFAASTITLTQFLDPTTALVNASTMTLQMANAMCNYNAWLSVSSQNGSLTSSNAGGVASGSGGFLSAVPFTVQANWGSIGVMLDTSTGAKVAKVQTGGANSGTLSLTFATQKSALPVVQGTYTDVVTVTVGASM